jgi:hypothetical protein
LSYYGNDQITVVDATQPPARVLFQILESVGDGVNGQHEPATV